MVCLSLTMLAICMATKKCFWSTLSDEITIWSFKSNALSSLIKWIATKTATPAHKKVT